MSKKIAIAVPFVLAALSSSMVFAADEGRTSINLVATVPSESFNVSPVDPELIVKDQKMDYSEATGDIASLRAEMDTRNSGGAIAARLESTAVLFNGTVVDNIPLVVTFNNETLGLTAVEVVNATEAAAGKRVDLVIAPTKPDTGGYKPGSYTGAVTMIFDAVPAVSP